MAEDFISGALAGQQFQLNNFLIQEAPVKLESEKLALTIAKQDQEKQQKLADMLAKNPPPEGKDPLENAKNFFLTAGTDAAKAGLTQEASDYISKGAQLATQQENAAYRNYESALKQADFATSILANVHDQASLDQANAYIKMSTGKPSALEGQTYSETLHQTLLAGIEKHVTKAEEEWKKAQARKENASAEAELALIPLREAEAEAARARATNLKKNGGKDDPTKAKPATVTEAYNAIQKEFQGTLEPNSARTVAYDVALEAEDKLRNGEAPNMPRAVAMAVKEAKENGKLGGNRVPRLGKGTSVKNPLPFPDSPEKLQDNMIYETPEGPQVWNADKKRFFPVGEEE